MNNRRRRFKRYYFITTYAVISVIIVAFGIGFVIEEHDGFERNILAHKQTLIENKKDTIKEIISAFAQRINNSSAEAEAHINERISNRLKTAYTLADALYKSGCSKEEKVRNIKTALSNITFKNSYVFIFDMNGTVISSPLQKDMEGENFLKNNSGKMTTTMSQALSVLRFQDEVSFVAEWQKPGTEKIGRKFVMLKKFAPLNWVIGYGEYEDDFIQEAQKTALKQLEEVTLSNNGYIFASTWDGISLTKPARGRDMLNTRDADGKYIVKDMIALSKTGGGFYEYTMPGLGGERTEKKISYVVGIPEWKWYIGTGIYLTDVENEYNAQIAKEKEKANEEVIMVTLITSLTLLLTGIITYILSSRMDKLATRHSDEINKKNEELEQLNKSLEDKVNEKTAELLTLNASLEKRIRQEVEKNREHEHIMFQQGRLASMGEMLSNIAHQWRQPLNNVGLFVQDIRETYGTDEFTRDYINTTTNSCMTIIQHMSKTIDNFRDFFKPNKDNTVFNINSQIEHSLTLLRASLENSRIEIIEEYGETGDILGIPGEFAQVLVNIITNSKDALTQHRKDNRFIRITTRSQKGYATAEIEDNGGGISYDIAEKIFEPYFTTKDEGKGTGIGLYFSKTIIEKNLGGNIIFSNTDSGVIFKISVPEIAH